jgi:hypothetical protein
MTMVQEGEKEQDSKIRMDLGEVLEVWDQDG